MHGQRRGVADDSQTTAPQGPLNKMIVLAAGPSGQPEQAAIYPDPIAMVDVMFLRLIRITGVKRLGGGEVATLAGSKALQLSPEPAPISNHDDMLAGN